MKRKIVLGSILAVVLMVLASCSTVVGAETEIKGTKIREESVETQDQQSVEKLKEKLESLIDKIGLEKTSDDNNIEKTGLGDILATIIGILLEVLAYIIFIPLFIIFLPFLLIAYIIAKILEPFLPPV